MAEKPDYFARELAKYNEQKKALYTKQFGGASSAPTIDDVSVNNVSNVDTELPGMSVVPKESFADKMVQEWTNDSNAADAAKAGLGGFGSDVETTWGDTIGMGDSSDFTGYLQTQGISRDAFNGMSENDRSLAVGDFRASQANEPGFFEKGGMGGTIAASANTIINGVNAYSDYQQSKALQAYYTAKSDDIKDNRDQLTKHTAALNAAFAPTPEPTPKQTVVANTTKQSAVTKNPKQTTSVVKKKDKEGVK